MELHDSIYGQINVDDPVLLDLMECDAMQRLKGVTQHGITALIGITPPFTRFDHCVGTMILVRHLGASLDEQIAALLHDVSHTAFSHVIDFVFDDHSGQSYHEGKKKEIIENSDIPQILTRHDKNWEHYLEEDQFQLLEQESPALCADRLDYFLRDLEFLGLANKSEINTVRSSLVVDNGKIAINNMDTARWVAYTFIEADRVSWSSFREVGLYQLTAEAIKEATKLNVINESDIWGSDKLLWKKLCSAEHKNISRYVVLITPGTRFIWDEHQPLFQVKTKVRSIDPPVIDGSSATPLSVLDPVFRQFRYDYLSEKQKMWPMRVVQV